MSWRALINPLCGWEKQPYRFSKTTSHSFAERTQEFVNFAQEHLGYRAQGVLSNPNTDTSMELLKNTAEQFVAQKLKPAIAQDYEAFKSNVNPEAEHVSQVQHMQLNSVRQDYAKQSASIQSAAVGTHYDSSKEKAIEEQANKTLQDNKQQTSNSGQNTLDSVNHNKHQVRQDIGEEKSKDDRIIKSVQKSIVDQNLQNAAPPGLDLL